MMLAGENAEEDVSRRLEIGVRRYGSKYFVCRVERS